MRLSTPAPIRAAAAVLAAACALAAAGCRVRDVRTATLRVDGLKDEASLRAAEAALSRLPDSRYRSSRGSREMSLKVLSADFGKGEITVRYDSMKVGIKNLQWALAEAGFESDAFDKASVAASREP